MRRDRRDRAGPLPRGGARGGPAPRVHRPDRARPSRAQAAGDPHPGRGRRDAGAARRARRRSPGHPALLLDGRSGGGVPGAPRLVAVVRRQLHLPPQHGADGRRAARPGRAAAGGDRCPLPVAAEPARAPQLPGTGHDHRPSGRARAPHPLRGARASGRYERRRCVRVVSGVTRSVPRSARQRELGQNFLIDRNILGVIERLAEVTSDDVVLEVGGGPGVLSERLAAAAGHVHVIEKDERLRETLLETVARRDNVEVIVGDALAVDLGSLAPAPTAMIANLPYGIAATLLLRTIAELESIGRWVVMVQREVGERLAAAPGTAAYGVPSVLAQLGCEVKVLRPVSRHVFRPVPNVDSVLLGMRRRADGGHGVPREVAAVVHGAFAHRRKALAGSLALSLPRPADGPGVRERAREALVALGHPADARAERLSPADFVALTRMLGGVGR